MKLNTKKLDHGVVIIGIAFGLGLCFWILDAVMNYYVIPNLEDPFGASHTFLGVLISDVPLGGLFVRFSVLGTLLLGGLLVLRATRKQEATEAALRESQSQLQLIADHIPALITYIDAGLHYRYVNRLYADWYRLDRESVIGKEIKDLVPDVAYQRALPHYQKALSGETVTFENVTYKDGEKRVVRVTLVPDTDDAGVIKGFYGMIQDVTAQVQAEEQVRMLERAVEQSSDGIAVADMEEKIQFVNPAWAAMHGYDNPESLKGQLIPIFHTEEEFQSVVQPFNQRVLTVGAGQTEMQHRRKDGSTFPTWMITTLLRDEEETPIGLVGIAHDITERKQTQEALQNKARQQEQLLDAARSLISSLDTHEVLTQIGSSAKELLNAYGCTIYLLEPDGKTLTPVVALEAYKEAIMAAPLPIEGSFTGQAIKACRSMIFNDALQIPGGFAVPGTPDDENENVIVAPFVIDETAIGAICLNRQGSYFTEEELALVTTFATYAAAALKNAQTHRALQEAEAALREERAALARRVAERTIELQETNAELSKALHAKDEFLATMSHELRTPLSAILALTELLREEVYGPLNEKQHKSLHGVEESGRHLLSLITDILDVSKIEAGKLELEISPVEVAELCQASLEFVQPQARAKHLKVVLTLDSTVSEIQVDKRRAKQILVNLLNNAVKFTPEGGEIGLEVKGDPGQKEARFTVWDKGIGIKPEDIKRIFEPFVQLDSTLSRQYEGTGLGLALTQRLAKLHGGYVSVESQTGAGSRFTVTLPWVPQVFPTPLPETPAENNPEVHEAETPCVILLAEDNAATREAIAEYLESKGYRVTTVGNGAEALDQLHQMRPDLIFMDIQMPGMDGLEATRQIRTRPDLAQVPIVALTALAMPGDAERCLEAGATAYLAKPFTLKQLTQIIEEQLQNTNP